MFLHLQKCRGGGSYAEILYRREKMLGGGRVRPIYFRGLIKCWGGGGLCQNILWT